MPAALRNGLPESSVAVVDKDGRNVPHPGFGLTSLLDYRHSSSPEELATAYPQPDRRSLERALVVMVDLHERATAAASVAIDADLTTSWSSVTEQRLHALLSENGAR
jgi:hypothetical protein